MVKFLSGGTFDGTRVPVCQFWRSDITTDPTVDFATLDGTGLDPQEAVDNPASGDSQCVANAYFPRSDITCFNQGKCNGSGQCLPCSKYKYGPMRFGITHSPPLDLLKQFQSGGTDADLESPNLASFPPNIVSLTEFDQMPLNVLYKNIMAQIAKCCHWNAGDGTPSQFYLATIIDGPDTKNITDPSGNPVTLKGIQITNPTFPDEVGSFAPVGLNVVAGFEGQPSFYLEPRTGLVKPGDGIIFGASGDANAPLVRVKQAATSCTQVMIDTVNAIGAVCNSLTVALNQQTDFYNHAVDSNVANDITTAQAKLDDITSRQTQACNDFSDAQTLGNDANALIGTIVNATDLDTATAAAKDLTAKFNQIADKAEDASSAGTGDSSAALASSAAEALRTCANSVQYAGVKSFSKCEFFFDDNNVAAQWNNPQDGTLPCNGVRTDCQFYTGEAWQFATDEKLDSGKKVTAEALQELRFRSDDWSKFDAPADEFTKRFSVPFIWAFDQYVDVLGLPDLEDLSLYKPKTLFVRDNSDFSENNFETIQMKKVFISDFTNLQIDKTEARVQTGSDSLDQSLPPQFPSLIRAPNVPTVDRLNITHPNKDQLPFIYRMWSPDKNKMTLFGTATPSATVYLINDTALGERSRYHEYLGTQNFVSDLPTGLPSTPDFRDVTVETLLDIFDKLQDEQRLNASPAPLGFDKVSTDRKGFWQSIQAIDLIHNTINTIYAIVIIDSQTILSDSTSVDCRFMHCFPVQTSFEATDFTLNNQGGGGGNLLGITESDTVKGAVIRATTKQVVGSEQTQFAYGYMGWRFIDRGLSEGTTPPDADLVGPTPIADASFNPATTEDPNTFVKSTTYSVFQYNKTGIEIANWYLVDDCGSIMIEIPDTNAHRVLPLPDQAGDVKPLSNVLVNGGGKGSVVAQFAITNAKLTILGEEKKLVQIYRDSDGFGLPANWVLLGPSTDVQQAFGRPVFGRDVISIDFTYLRAQTAGGTISQPAPGDPLGEGDLVKDNFYGDKLRGHATAIEFADNGDLTAGDGEEDGTNKADAVRSEQQEYVWVFTDSESRPIGRKVSRMMEIYYNLACINVEMYYGWNSTCTTYGLSPDFFLSVGQNNGTLTVAPKGTIDPRQLVFGGHVFQDLGEFPCNVQPSCADHEILELGGLRKEFEVIEEAQDSDIKGKPVVNSDGSPKTGPKAAYPSAGGPVTGKILSTESPGSQFEIRKGAMWYPYINCTRARYNFATNGPLNTDSTELINTEVSPPGISPSIGEQVLQDTQVAASQGVYGLLPRTDMEAYRGVDRVIPKILDIHPSLRACTEANTYANQVLTGRNSEFSGVARRRGEIDLFWYQGFDNWDPPKFGNFGRNKLLVEVTEKRGDYLGGDDNKSVGFRWMPMFPEREDLGSGIGLFSEDVEPQHYRFIQTANPGGGIGETVDFTRRFRHKNLITNGVSGLIEYPYVGYYPSFLPDSLLGTEPEDRAGSGDTTITTMWAWREQDRPIGRGQNGSRLLTGIQFQSPDYFLDQRRLEIRLRPTEGLHTITFKPPTYNQDDGSLATNASLKFDQGPEREIVIDFKNKKMSIADQPDTVYDTSKNIGDTPFPCTDGTAVDNPLLTTRCSCIKDVNDPALKGPPPELPAQVLHLDSLAPAGFFVIYEGADLNTPFATALQRSNNDSPCCLCLYYIRGIFAKLDLEFLPTADRIDPSFDGRSELKYTWSRPPHGSSQGVGTDGFFAANENLIDNYIDINSGDVLINRFTADTKRLDLSSNAAAVFPSVALANSSRIAGNPIPVVAVPGGDLHNGGIPATNGVSFGEDEVITLDMLFDTYVRVRSVTVTFFAGKGWQVPTVRLGLVDPQFRGTGSNPPSVRTARIIGVSDLTSNGTDVPFIESFDRDAIQQGLPGGLGAKFPVTITPTYRDMAFWNQFGMEAQLIFDRRDGQNSMGIASIQLEVEAMSAGEEITEDIFVPERQYYISTGTPDGGNNPEAFLEQSDSATVYWRQTEVGAKKGTNRFRAYAFGDKIEDNQSPIRGEPQDLEKLQEKEYDTARDLLVAPYVYTFVPFTPKEESDALMFYAGAPSSTSLTLTLNVSPIAKVQELQASQPLYGVVPNDRRAWNAAGHTWTYNFKESYQFCCGLCPKSMVIDYNFAHLHDGLAVVETAQFWDELPSGFTRLIRSTVDEPDPTFGQSNESGLGIDGGTTGQAVLMDASTFTDSQGNPIDPSILENAGFRKDDNGNLVLIPQGGE